MCPARVPILDGARAERAAEQVRVLVEALAFDRLSIDAPGIAEGHAGIATFLVCAAQAGFADAAQEADRHFAAAMDAVATRPLGVDLFTGFTGVGWALAHAGADAGDGLEDLDASLTAHASRQGGPMPFDLAEGWVGLGIYALERGPAGHALLAAVVRALATHAFRLPDAAAWVNPAATLPEWQRARFPEGLLDVGVAHGTPGVAGLLARAADAGVEAETARPIAETAMRWVLAQRIPGASGRQLPAFLASGAQTAPPEPARSAWCYGDPGVAVCLLGAARRLGLGEVEAELLAIARSAAALPPEQSGVVDASLCHGSAGLAHLYGRLFRATGDASFRDAACAWLDRTLAFAQPGAPCGGYSATKRDPSGETRVPDASLLNGAAGVGLALLSALAHAPLGWDRLLLMDL